MAMFDEEKLRSVIDKNINLINDYLNYLSENDINHFYEDMNEIFFFYHFNSEAVREIVENRTSGNISTNKLVEFEGITNGMLFRLKYKLIPQTLKNKGFNINHLSEI